MNKSLVFVLVCSLAAGLFIAGGTAGAEATITQPHIAGVLGGIDLARNENGQDIGTGNGHIHIIPALSAKSVKNGDRVTVQAVVKALDGVAGVEARIEREDNGMAAWGIDSLAGMAMDTLKLAGAPLNSGGADAGGTTGIWQSEWSASGLEEGYYRIAVTVTDKTGRTWTDRSLRFSDPLLGYNAAGSSVYPNNGMRRVDKLSSGANLFRCATGDTTTGYAYLGTDTSPGTIVKVALGTGSAPPTQVASLTLHTGEDKPSIALIDTANGYAYFGTYTAPGRVVKVALGAGATAPTWVGSVTLSTGEDALASATGNPATGYILFGTDTSPGRVVKVATGAGAALPSRASALPLNTGENNLRCAVSDLGDGYAYFGTYTLPGTVVKVLIGAGAAAPTRTAALALNSGDNLLTSAVTDAASNYAYFGTNTSPGIVVKVALGAAAAAPTRLGSVTLNSGENSLSTARLDLASGYAYFGTNTSPGTLVRVALGAAGAAPTRLGAVTLNSGENSLSGMLVDLSAGFAYLSTNTTPGSLVRVGLSQKGFLKATKFTLMENGGVGSVSFYSHASAGSARLAIYDNSASPALVWQSASTANTAANSWLTVPIAGGTPTSLLLQPGVYWLGWQVDVTTPVPSWTAGTAGDGLCTPTPYGTYSPAALDAGSGTAATLTDERWSEYFTYWAPPAPPNNPTAPTITRNAITWSWADNSSDETGFQVYDDPAPLNPPTSLQTITAPNVSSWTHNGLISNTLYAFRACATNLYGNSALTASYSAWTLASTPNAPIVNNATLSTLDVAISADVNPENTLYALWIVPFTGSNTWVQNDGTLAPSSVNQTAALWGTKTVQGLQPSTTYQFFSRAKNGAGTTTGFSLKGAGTTLPAVPSAPTVGNAYVHTLDLTLTADANSSETLYAIQIMPDVGGKTWVQADGSVGASPAYQTLAAWGTKTITGLAAARSYSFSVGAKNAAGVTSAFGPSGAGATLAALTMVDNPVGGTVYVGDSFPLSVTTSGGRAPLTYQWQKGGSDILTGTLPTLSINPAALADAGTYTCRVRDAGTENVLSGSAVLSVAEHLSITAPPTGGTAYVGELYSLTVVASGGIGTLSYQWQKNGTDIPGKTLDTLSFASLTPGDAGTYTCRVRDARTDDKTSAEAVLAVDEHLSITTPPAGMSAYVGGDVTFTIVASGGIGTLTYQWYRGGAEITGETLDTLHLTNLGSGDAAAYTCRVRDAVTDEKFSPDAVLVVADHLLITGQTGDGLAYVGDPYALKVETSGGIGTLRYQWQKDGNDITGETLDTLSFANLATGDSAAYTCLVHDAATDHELSAAAVLSVSEHVTITTLPTGGPAYIGGEFTFAAAASGGIGALRYQWYKDGAELTGETGDTLHLASLVAGDSAAYTWRVRDAVTDDKISPDAELVVMDHLTVTTPPAGGFAYTGDPFAFTIVASNGLAPLKYQWRKDGTDITGETGDTLSLTHAATKDAAAYSCRVSDALTDKETSADAVLAVADRISMVTQPQPQTVVKNSAATFTVEAAGGFVPLHYHWLKDGISLPGGPDAPELVINSAAYEDAGNYSAEVYDSHTDSIASDTATLTVVDGVPVTGALGLAALALTAALGGARTLRRKK